MKPFEKGSLSLENSEMPAPLSIEFAQDSDRAAWDGYVRAHPEGTAFHLWAWRDIVSSVHGHKGYFLVARHNDAVVGVLPLAHQKTFFGNALVSLPFCPYGGPVADNQDIELQLIKFARHLTRKIGANSLELRRLRPTQGIPDVATQLLYVAFRKNLSADHEANLTAIPRKQRAMVRKGLKNNLSATVETVDTFYPLYCDNIHRHGTPGSPIGFFKAIEQAFGKDCECMIVRNADGIAVTGVLSLYFRDEVLPFYAGDIPLARESAANDFKYWEVMRHAVERGARLFDYGRSKKETGPFAFKTNWGFEPTQLHYEHYDLPDGKIPEHNPLNPKYQLMIKVWRKLPRPFVNWLGPKIVKGLG